MGRVEPKGIHANPKAIEESFRLKEIFDQRTQTIRERRENCWKISYLNVASLLNKTEDVANDNNITDSDIFGIGETWMKPSGTLNFAGFTEHLANYGKGKGVCSFSRM